MYICLYFSSRFFITFPWGTITHIWGKIWGKILFVIQIAVSLQRNKK